MKASTSRARQRWAKFSSGEKRFLFSSSCFLVGRINPVLEMSSFEAQWRSTSQVVSMCFRLFLMDNAHRKSLLTRLKEQGENTSILDPR